jgi:hypothetical protein
MPKMQTTRVTITAPEDDHLHDDLTSFARLAGQAQRTHREMDGFDRSVASEILPEPLPIRAWDTDQPADEPTGAEAERWTGNLADAIATISYTLVYMAQAHANRDADSLEVAEADYLSAHTWLVEALAA